MVQLVENHVAAAKWAVAYISNAATARRRIVTPAGNVIKNVSNYNPPRFGVHLCGVTDDGEQPTSAASYPTTNEEEARALWDMAKSVAACSRDEGDFVVDLVIDDEIGEDFWTNRQLWPRAIEAWNAEAQSRMAHQENRP